MIVLKLGIISVTEHGDSIAYKLSKYFETEIYYRDRTKALKISTITKNMFQNYGAIVFIASTGIAVRAIAPYIRDKTVDPAIIVIDSTGKYVISLLSGHIGGANNLAIEIAKIIGAEPIITTATDNLNIVAPDSYAKEHGLILEDMKTAKEISTMLVEGKRVAFIDRQEKYSTPKGYIEDINGAEGAVIVSNEENIEEELINNKPTLKLIRRNIVLGIGCRKDFDDTAMKNKVLEVLGEYNLDRRSVLKVATVEVKKEEKAIINLAKELNAEITIFTLEEIRKVHEKYEGSAFVEKTIGVRAVSEPCVELLGAKLKTGKIKCNGMTLCIGEIL